MAKSLQWVPTPDFVTILYKYEHFENGHFT